MKKVLFILMVIIVLVTLPTVALAADGTEGGGVIDWTDLIWKVAIAVIPVLLAPPAKKAYEWFKTTTLFAWVKKFISYAEAYITTSGSGAKKKALVIDLLKNMGLVTNKNEEYVSAIIDGICKELTAEGVINTDASDEKAAET